MLSYVLDFIWISYDYSVCQFTSDARWENSKKFYKRILL